MDDASLLLLLNIHIVETYYSMNYMKQISGDYMYSVVYKYREINIDGAALVTPFGRRIRRGKCRKMNNIEKFTLRTLLFEQITELLKHIDQGLNENIILVLLPFLL